MTTYYVDGVDGADVNAGTSEGSGNAWATVDKAMNTVAAGDLVYIKGNGTYSETPVMDTAGTSAAPIIFEGYTTTPGDNGKATISGTTNCMTGAVPYYIFKNLIFSGASSYGVLVNTSDVLMWVNCEFNNNGSDGVNADLSQYFINCVAHSNTGNGIDCNTGALVGNVLYGNASQQARMDNASLIYKNVVFGTAGVAIFSPNCSNWIGNTVDGEGSGGDGFVATSTSTGVIVDNIIYDCVTGVDFGASPIYANTMIGYNLVNSNSTADYDASGGVIGYQDVTGAPAFTDEAGDDYTLGASSPAIDAGLMPGGIT